MNRGDVVEVDWPYSDLMGSKLRPAVVVQADFLNGLIDDTIFVQITSTKHGIPGTEVAIDPAVETASDLSHLCYANCMNVLTRD
jgi:mRNA-degrading endonuclease toxin of MazEF toxin-antitoxin module